MRGQIYSRGKHSARLAEQISLLPRTSIWSHYLQYNTVVDLLTKGEDGPSDKNSSAEGLEKAIFSLKGFIGDLETSIKESTS